MTFSTISEDVAQSINVFGQPLELCCNSPITGFYRDGFCNTGSSDYGTHVVCSIMTKEFLEYSKSMGNDLSTPNEMYAFPGLKPGDKWCVCVLRWKEAFDAGKAPKVILEATHDKALKYVTIEQLISHAQK
tara:strand:+ start:262 stop:654 length:393 start_codon:yes stop_codon:yes gene_type:complete